MVSRPEFIIRFASDEDFRLIHSSWFKAVRETPPNNLIPGPIFREHQNRTIETAQRIGSTIVLCHPDDPGEVFGYLCYSRLAGVVLIHWAYVGRLWRGLGLADALLSQADPGWRHRPLVVTQPSRALIQFQSKFPQIAFDPYFLREHTE